MGNIQPNKEVRRVSAPEKAEKIQSPDRRLESARQSVRGEIPPEVEMAEIASGVEKILPSESGEKSSEDKHVHAGRSQKRREDAKAFKKRLMASKPLVPKMMRDIKTKLYEEKKVLKKEERKLKRASARAAYRLNSIVQRLREIHQLIEKLADMAYDALKKLWLKIVYGIV